MLTRNIQALVASTAISTSCLAALSAPQHLEKTQDTSAVNQSLFSGPLSGLKPPILDGAISSGSIYMPNVSASAHAESIALGAVVAGMLGGFIGIFCHLESYAETKDIAKRIAAIAAASALAGGIGGHAMYAESLAAREVSSTTFNTHVSKMLSNDNGHIESRGKGGSATYFSQVFYVPESEIPFAANTYAKPFIVGQNITMTVFYYKDSGEIVCASAGSGLRDTDVH